MTKRRRKRNMRGGSFEVRNDVSYISGVETVDLSQYLDAKSESLTPELLDDMIAQARERWLKGDR